MVFMKKRKFGGTKGKYSEKRGKNIQTFNKLQREEEITTSEDEGVHSKTTESEAESSENEQETPQEKRLRLAKTYLQEIENEEKKRLDQDEIEDSIVGKRLRDDYLKQSGRLQLKVASKYSGCKTDVSTLQCKDHKRTLTCLCVSSSNEIVYSGSKDGTIVKWSIKDRKRLSSIPFVKVQLVSTSKTVLGHNKIITAIAISWDDKYLAAADETSNIQIWNGSDLSHIRTFSGHRSSVNGLSFRIESHSLYSCSKDKSVKVWSLAEMSYVETLYGHQDGIMAIDAAFKERAITGGGKDGTVRLWKIADESQLIYNAPGGSIDVVKFINEDCFASAGDAGELCIWSSLKKRPLCSVKSAHGSDPINGQPYWISSIATLRNTDLIASGSQDGSIRLWKLGDGFRSITALFEIPVCGFVNSIEFTSDGTRLIAAVGQEHKLGRWNVLKNAKNCVIIATLQKNDDEASTSGKDGVRISNGHC